MADAKLTKEACARRVQSVCPVCGEVAYAEYAERGGAVYFDICCPKCGAAGVFSELASEDAAAFDRFMAMPSVTVAPRAALTEGVRRGAAGGAQSACPFHCGVCGDHLMTACCVLLDVTERCDQHCPWCFARADTLGDGSEGEPPLDEIGRWYDRLIELGEERPFNIQLSGGEPTVRHDLPEIVELGRAKGFEYIQLNTNGRRLAGSAEMGAGAGVEAGQGYARRLRSAGVSVVYLQFDGMSDSVYGELRGEPLLDIKLRAIENCAKAGLPVVLVPTIVKGVNIFESADGAAGEAADGAGEIGGMIDFMLANLGAVKGIHFQPASFFGRTPDASGESNRVTMFAVMNEIERQTGGRLRASDLLPITTGHPLCCFCANFMREPSGRLASMMSKAQREGGAACCDEMASGSEAACCCPSAPDPLEIVRRDRDFVLNKWSAPNEAAPPPAPADAAGIMSFDEALSWFQNNMFTISGMAFMDRSNLDAERLKRCRVQYFTPDEKLIPFCAYNTMYRRT
ncbi:MAG: radical SAM protein [Clostridiales Family XIII bacterium]|nr:radical SAM protein [Clostridiales Family XIII bacterium]